MKCPTCGTAGVTVAPQPAGLNVEISDNQAALESLPYAVQAADLNLPARVVVDQHGHYWRDYGEFLSMPPVSDENVETEVVAAFALVQPAPEEEMANFAAAEEHPTRNYEVIDKGGSNIEVRFAQPAPDALTCPHGAEWDGRIWTKVSQPAPDALRAAAQAFVDIWGESEAMLSSHTFLALRAALGDEP